MNGHAKTHDTGSAQGLLAFLRDNDISCVISDGYVLSVHGIRPYNDIDVAVVYYGGDGFYRLLKLVAALRDSLVVTQAPSGSLCVKVECVDCTVEFFDSAYKFKELQRTALGQFYKDEYGNHIASLATVRREKVERGREKDLADIELIDKHLRSDAQLAGSKKACPVCDRINRPKTCSTCSTVKTAADFNKGKTRCKVCEKKVKDYNKRKKVKAK